MGIILPTNTNYTQPTLWNSFRYQQLPQFIQVPIIAGQLDQTTQVFWNSNMEPPGTQYVWYWFDAEANLIYPASGAATPASINVATYTIIVPVSNLIKPSYSGATNPVPES